MTIKKKAACIPTVKNESTGKKKRVNGDLDVSYRKLPTLRLDSNFDESKIVMQDRGTPARTQTISPDMNK